MRSKSMFLIIACVCGAVAAVGASQFIQGQGTPTVVQTTEIFVAARVIEPSEQITAGMMTLESWPADRAPTGATNDLTLLEGKFAGQRFFQGEPMMVAKLVESGNGISVQIPDGYSVVSMRADAANSVGTLIRPGDRVNVMAYFSKSDQIPETGVKTVLRGVKVFAMDGRTSRATESESTSAAGTVSLLIYKEDEEAWTYASELGRIRLSLSGPADALNTEETRRSGRDFLAWLSEHQKSRQVAAKPAVVEAAPVQRAEGFKMLKLHGGSWTEYEIPAGNLPPIVTGTSDTGSNTSAPKAKNGLSQLNGSQSPFFESPATQEQAESVLFTD
jgi:pilus assembly protein CpaB